MKLIKDMPRKYPHLTSALSKALKDKSPVRDVVPEDIKPITDFIHYEEFSVEHVTERNHATSSIVGETIIGGRNQTQEGGYTTTSTLRVKPVGKIPIRALVFYGHTTARQGDKITARVKRFSTRSTLGHRENVYDSGFRTVYLDRPYKEEETAIEIRNLTQGRIEQAVDYVPLED